MIPDLTRWPEADELLDQALALPSNERVAFVRRTATNAELAKAIEAVLAEAAATDDFLQPAGALSGFLGHELRQGLADAAPVLPAGAFVEHYQVVAAIGQGGMGEVYRARDSKLARDVALKVLPERYASDPDRQARFRREARVLASLNHPGIAAIYGIAESQGIEALVLELVEGPTLAELIDSGPLPMSDVIGIATQLVDAIAAAHQRGILHRDLKPANVKVAPGGGVKILDFGLARVLASESAEAPVDLTRNSAQVLIGTASYMSPEQARGHRVDERTDVWAFGCVLFEMMTGTRAFAGNSVADVLAAVIEREPAFSLLPTATPDAMRRLLRRCLDKNPDRRLGFIGDARLELDDATALPALDGSPGPPRGKAAVVVGALSAAAVIAAITVLWSVPFLSRAPLPVARLVMPLPAGDRPVTGFQPMMALSPDGRTIVYRARRAATTQLFRRDLDSLEAVPIAGTEGATSPMFSPDGRWLAFDADGVLKRVTLAGGTPVVITHAPGGVTGAWLSDNTLVFATNTTRVLQRVSVSGGTPQPITSLDAARGDTLHLLPSELPGRRALLFTVVAGAGRHVAALDLDTGAVSTVAQGSHGVLVADDVLVFARDGALWAAPFDAERLALTGNAAPLEERVAHTDNTVFHYATIGGALVYLPPESAAGQQRMVWIDRSGRVMPVDLEPGPYVRVSLSPDNSQLAVALDEESNQDIWIANPQRQTMTRLTFDPTIETMPTWSPDGRYVAFRSEREAPGIYRRAAQGTGDVERLTATDGPIHSPYSWTPDGKTLLLAVFRSFRNQAIASVTPPDPAVRILLDGDFAQLDPQVSPDGRWLAYQSDETGRFEVYVRPYPDVDAGRWLVSTAGGTSPRWAPDGRELLYYDGEALARVTVRTSPTFSPGKPERLLAIKPFGGRLGPDFEVASNGQRFLFLLPGATEPTRSAGLVLVQNWVEEIRARLAMQR
jgi:serine/threonine-protein kinase